MSISACVKAHFIFTSLREDIETKKNALAQNTHFCEGKTSKYFWTDCKKFFEVH